MNNKLNERKLRQGYFTFLIAKTLTKKKLNINISKDIKKINEISELTNSSDDYLRNRELYEFQFQELQSIDIQINEDFEP